ncbi:MAG: hypothetical protein ACI9DO_000675 [Reinekea sp.]|jgi:hypothetical protein
MVFAGKLASIGSTSGPLLPQATKNNANKLSAMALFTMLLYEKSILSIPKFTRQAKSAF